MNSGIYQIRCFENDNIYVGSTTNFAARWVNHVWRLKINKHFNAHLQSSWNKYGEENFIFEILEEVGDKDDLIKREQFFIDFLFPEYNICKIAGAPFKGRKHSEEWKKLMSKKMSGKKNPMYGVRLCGEKNPMYGVRLCGEKNPMYGVRLCGEKNGFYGKKHSKETRKKLSEASKRRIITEETRKKLSIANLGKNNYFYGMRGEKCPGSKLTLEKVREIRKRFEREKISMRKLGRQYGVSHSTISNILKHKTWRNV